MNKDFYICLFGGASENVSPIHLETVEQLGKEIGTMDCDLVYGAGATGCMGAIARGVDASNGYILGVTPEFMSKIEPEYNCTRTIKTLTMNERKTIMETEADFYIIAPGGIGTMDEFFEVLTLKCLNQCDKPIIIFNINGFYDNLLKLLEQFVEDGFANKRILSLFEVCTTIDEIKIKINEVRYGK